MCTFVAHSVLARNTHSSPFGHFAEIYHWHELIVVEYVEGCVQFEFVAVIPDKDIGAVEGSLGKLTFDSLKAISYPGGARMATFTACELDSLSDECDGEQEKFISK